MDSGFDDLSSDKPSFSYRRREKILLQFNRISEQNNVHAVAISPMIQFAKQFTQYCKQNGFTDNQFTNKTIMGLSD